MIFLDFFIIFICLIKHEKNYNHVTLQHEMFGGNSFVIGSMRLNCPCGDFHQEI